MRASYEELSRMLYTMIKNLEKKPDNTSTPTYTKSAAAGENKPAAADKRIKRSLMRNNYLGNVIASVSRIAENRVNSRGE